VAKLTVRVTARASQDKVTFSDGIVRIWVTPPPAEGRANSAIVELLAKRLGVPKSSLLIERGSKSRDKSVQVSGMTQERLDELIKELST